MDDPAMMPPADMPADDAAPAEMPAEEAAPEGTM
jgi:hypothetical protein